jgi:uncharacterized protein (DUF697 family)
VQHGQELVVERKSLIQPVCAAMPLTYDEAARREIERWVQSGGPIWQEIFDRAMRPIDKLVAHFAPAVWQDQLEAAVARFLETLHDVASWTYNEAGLLQRIRQQGLAVEHLEALELQPLERLDPLARPLFGTHAVLAALEGAGTGLGGLVWAAADIPLLFTINLRLIQQIGAVYGFRVQESAFRPLVLAVFNAASAGTSQARQAALREVSVAAALLARGAAYQGRTRDFIREQNRHLPRELVKNLARRKLGQLIPLAGLAVGAGINYAFTRETGHTAYMLFRALHLERRGRR